MPSKQYSHYGVILIAGIVYSLLIACLPLDVFWITDGGNKFIQIKSMALSGLPDVSVQYPAKDIDPDLAFFPYGGHHFREIGGKIYSAYPFYFPLLSLIPFRVFGIAGLYVLPVLSSILCLILTCFMVHRIYGQTKCRAALVVLAFFTPFLFYSLTFWEHTLATMFFTLCLLLMIKSRKNQDAGRQLLLAGLSLGLSTVFREEGYLLFCALAAGALFAFDNKQNVLPLIIGWLLVMVPVWILQQKLYHHFLGLHTLTYHDSFSSIGGILGLFNPADVLANWFLYLFRFHESRPLAYLLSIPFITAVVVGLWRETARGVTTARCIVALAACVTSSVLFANLVSHDDPVFNTLFTQALMPSTPFLVFFMLFLRPSLLSKDPDTRLLTWTAIVFILGSGFLLHQKDVGIIWGPRHFVSLYPILVILSLAATERILGTAKPQSVRGALRVSAITLFALSLFIQWHGVHTLYLKKKGTEALVQSVSRLTNEIVVTDVYWFPEEAAPIFYETKILMVDSDEDLLALLQLLRTKNIEDFTFVTSRYYHRLSNKGLDYMVPFVKQTQQISPPGMEFMSLHVSSCRL